MTLHRSDMGQYIFPIELWELIFELATACAEEWEFGRMERSMTFWGRSPNTINRWQDVLKTRRSLATTSWLFNQLTSPLLYQSFFAISSRQVSCFTRTLQARPALGAYVKRLGPSPPLNLHVHLYFPQILGLCPNILFCDTELRLSDLMLPPPLRSLELIVTPELSHERRDAEFLHLLARLLQATPQLEHLGVYWLPYRVEVADIQPFAAITLGSLRSLHLRICTQRPVSPNGTIITAPLFFSLTLPRLEHLLLEGTDVTGWILDSIPSSWLRHIRHFSVTLDSIAGCDLEPNHFALLRKLTLDFSAAYGLPRQRLDARIPFTQLEEIELFYCATPISLEVYPGFDGLHSVLSLCADATATPKLRLLVVDLTNLEEECRLSSTETVWKRFNELLSVVKLIVVRGIDPKGLDSSLLLPALQRLVTGRSIQRKRARRSTRQDCRKRSRK